MNSTKLAGKGLQHPIRPVLIGRVWYVTDETTNIIHGPFDSSWSAIEKTQQLRGGKTATTTKGQRDKR